MYIDYLTLFSPHNLALLSDWLEETGELYVDVYQVRHGGTGDAYFISSMRDLKALIAKQYWRELAVTVFRKRQYPLRGVADEALLKAGLELIPEGEWYTIVSLETVYPSYVHILGEGNTHEEFRQEFAEVLGKRVGIGQNPFDQTLTTEWFAAHTDEAFTVSYTQHNHFAILKNQDSYEPYAQNPAKYQWLIDLWQR